MKYTSTSHDKYTNDASRPDMTFAVDWVLNNNYLSIPDANVQTFQWKHKHNATWSMLDKKSTYKHCDIYNSTHL